MSTILTHFRIRQATLAAAAAFVALTLQACGGSGNNTPQTNTTSVNPTTPPNSTVSVNPTTPPPPTATISVNPTTITVGQTATLTWSSTHAASCSAGGSGWSGNQQVMGSATETPTTAGTVTYTLTCTGAVSAGGAGGTALTATQMATLTVNQATAYVVKALVADGAGVAATQDPILVNAWGLVLAPNNPVWIANTRSSTSAQYDGYGLIQYPVASLPAAANGTAFQPTGIVAFTPSTQFPNDFTVTANGNSGPSLFIYSGLGGQLAVWSPGTLLLEKNLPVGFSGPAGEAVSAYAATDGACYRGLAIANNGTANFLYATDFVNGKIDVFDAKFTKQNPSAFPFKDPNLPPNYAPSGIQAIANGPNGTTQIYVSYAMSGTGTNQGTCNDTPGLGFGMLDVFDANGKLVTELVKVGGRLNAPWGMALAPKDFGTLSGALLVSNHTDGTINGYDPTNGTFIGTLQTAEGQFAQDGLWGIAFGNDAFSQPHNTLFFTAGPNDGTNGLYGRIDLPAN